LLSFFSSREERQELSRLRRRKFGCTPFLSRSCPLPPPPKKCCVDSLRLGKRYPFFSSNRIFICFHLSFFFRQIKEGSFWMDRELPRRPSFLSGSLSSILPFPFFSLDEQSTLRWLFLLFRHLAWISGNASFFFSSIRLPFLFPLFSRER